MRKLLIPLFVFISFGSFAQKKEPWVSKPFEQWPQIALINDVLYKNGDRYEDPTITYVGSGFLLDTGKETLAVTVKHVLWVARNKTSKNITVNDQLKKWKMYPKKNPKDSVVIGQLINEDPTEKLFDGYDNGVLQRDWLVFTTQSVSPKIQPLKMREETAKVGEKVYLTGNPYRFDQTITVAGKIIKREGPHIFVKLDGMEKTFLGGSSGSPLIDANGQLIGIFSNTRKDDKTGENVFIFNSTDYLKRVLSGAKPLNVNRNPISNYLDSLLKTQTVAESLKGFDQLYKSEKVHEQYEITYFNHNNILKIGDEFLSQKRVNDAILFYEYFYKLMPNHMYITALAKSYIQAGQKQKALSKLQAEVERPDIDPEVKGEITKFMKEINN
ncbi:S1 family peptidase [Runella aurantiaca]|uniref:Serine protease n=1 Tax=Runella aurantiaca TaxID=2282308 RepID=A0A369I6C2_9BACT|nr:serine protease [Runella aurantiaca]RDB05361.1 serine protease [Runella aurantiaca]